MGKSSTSSSKQDRPADMPSNARTAEPYRAAQMYLISGTLLLGVLAAPGVVLDRYSLPRATLYALAVVLLAALSTVRALRVGYALVPRSPALVLAAIFCVALGVATMANDDVMRAVIGPYTRYTGLAMYVVYVMIMGFTLRSYDRESMRGLIWVLVVALGFTSAYGLVQLGGLDPVDWPKGGSSDVFGQQSLPTEFATFGNINFAAGFVGVTSPLALWGALDRRTSTWARVCCGAALVAAVAYSFGNGSSQGPLALAAGAVVVIAGAAIDRLGPAEDSAHLKRRRWALVAAVVVGVVALVPIAGYVGTEVDDAGGRERQQMWETAIDLWIGSPLLGNGLGSFSEDFPAERPPEHAESNRFLTADAPHNVVLEFLVGGGLLGALPYVGFIGYVGFVLVRGLVRSVGDDRWMLAGVGGAWAGYQVQSMVSIDVPPVAVLHWVLAGAVLLLANNAPLRKVSVPGVATPARGRKGVPRVRPASPTMLAGTAVVAILAMWVVTVPFRADRAALRAMEARSASDLDATLDASARATELAPWEGSYWAQRAAALDKLGDLESARKAGIEAAERADGSAFYALAVAALSQRIGDDEATEAWLAEAAERDPHNPAVQDAVRTSLGQDEAPE